MTTNCRLTKPKRRRRFCISPPGAYPRTISPRGSARTGFDAKPLQCPVTPGYLSAPQCPLWLSPLRKFRRTLRSPDRPEPPPSVLAKRGIHHEETDLDFVLPVPIGICGGKPSRHCARSHHLQPE